MYIFLWVQENSHLRRQLQVFLSNCLDITSITPQSAIFQFLDDDFKHKIILKHILLIFNLIILEKLY